MKKKEELCIIHFTQEKIKRSWGYKFKSYLKLIEKNTNTKISYSKIKDIIQISIEGRENDKAKAKAMINSKLNNHFFSVVWDKIVYVEFSTHSEYHDKKIFCFHRIENFTKNNHFQPKRLNIITTEKRIKCEDCQPDFYDEKGFKKFETCLFDEIKKFDLKNSEVKIGFSFGLFLSTLSNPVSPRDVLKCSKRLKYHPISPFSFEEFTRKTQGLFEKDVIGYKEIILLVVSNVKFSNNRYKAIFSIENEELVLKRCFNLELLSIFNFIYPSRVISKRLKLEIETNFKDKKGIENFLKGIKIRKGFDIEKEYNKYNYLVTEPTREYSIKFFRHKTFKVFKFKDDNGVEVVWVKIIQSNGIFREELGMENLNIVKLFQKNYINKKLIMDEIKKLNYFSEKLTKINFNVNYKLIKEVPKPKKSAKKSSFREKKKEKEFYCVVSFGHLTKDNSDLFLQRFTHDRCSLFLENFHGFGWLRFEFKDYSYSLFITRENTKIFFDKRKNLIVLRLNKKKEEFKNYDKPFLDDFLRISKSFAISIHIKKKFFHMDFVRIFEKTIISKTITKKEYVVSNEILSLYSKLDEEKKLELSSLFDNGIYCLPEFTHEILKQLISVSFVVVFNFALLCKSRKILVSQMKKEIKKIENVCKTEFSVVKDNQNLSLIKYFEIHPFKIVFRGSYIEMSNRISRKFPNLVCRVKFMNVSPYAISFKKVFMKYQDNLKYFEISKANKPVDETLKSRIKEILHNGFNYRGVHYNLLLFSSSGIRKRSLFFLKKNSQISSETMLSQIGKAKEFSSAKYFSRLSLAFSSTVKTFKLLKNEYTVVDDIQNEKYCFSDGCGRINKEFSLEISKQLGVEDISVFQIRFGGFKGTLIAENSDLGGKKVIFSKSMMKFHSNDDYLEIVGYSSSRKYFLNRQNILILKEMGLKNSYFLKKIKDFLQLIDNNIDEVITNQINKKIVIELVDVLESDLFRNELFFSKLRKEAISKAIDAMIEKQKIPVSTGVCTYGVCDFSKCLNEGEVYVSYVNFKGKKIIMSGSVLISRSPSHHSGDIRLLKAVNNSSLSHLTNVLVFNVKGERPEFDKMNFGDLDGDLYSVLPIDEELSKKIQQKPPNVRTTKQEKGEKQEFTKKDLISFILVFFENYNLEIMSDFHLYFSNKFGMDDLRSKNFANKCQIANDFVKSGIFCKLEEGDLEHFKKHFVLSTKLQNNIFHQSSTIGTISIRCSQIEKTIILENFEEKLSKTKARNIGSVLHEIACGEYEYLVKPCYCQYKAFFYQLFDKYEMNDEYTFLVSNRRNHYFYKKLFFSFRNLVNNLREKIFDQNDNEETLKKKLSCCYNVCCDDEERIYSFPWIIGGNKWKVFVN